jgi:hypothetical protein
MAIIAKGSDFVPCPEGLHMACLVDVIDKGDIEGKWGTRHKIVLVWETSQKMENGKPFLARKMYTLSLDPKATLHKDLASWRGRPFTTEEMKGFDIERVIGASCRILIKHTERDGVVWANVDSILKTENNQRLAPSGQYQRVKDREPEKDAFGRQAGDDGWEGYPEEEPLRLPERASEDAIPF